MTESLLGIMICCAALVGIIASVAYPFLRRRIGLVRTGQLGLSCEIAALSFCVLSLWMPGSAFDPLHWTRDHTQTENNTLLCSPINESFTQQLQQDGVVHSTLLPVPVNCNDTLQDIADDRPKTSLILLYAGIIAARFGKGTW